MNRVDVLYTRADAEAVAEFIEALKAHGLEVQTADSVTSSDCPVAVLITASMLGAEEAERVQAVAQGYDEVLPVSFLPGPAPIFAGLSQSLISQLGVDKCAARISTIVQHGGKAIIGWNNLVADALRWQNEGRQALIPEAELGGSLALLQSGPAKESERRELVRNYIEASQQAVGRRRRIGQTVIAVSATILVAVLVFAVVQAISARVAQNRSQQAADTATASRLAREATNLIPGDPDLPTLLALRALHTTPSPAAQTAVARVAASTWPHTSHHLAFKPQGIHGARESERVAIVKAGEGMVVYDSPGGNILKEFPFDDPSNSDGTTALLSPNGNLLAVHQPNTSSIKIFDVNSGDELPDIARPGGIALLDWLDSEHVLIGRDNQLVSVNAADGAIEVIAETTAGEVIDSGSVSTEQNRIIAATGGSVVIVNTTTHAVEHTRRSALRDPSLSADGKRVLGIDYPQPVSYFIDDDETTVPEPHPFAARQILPIDGQYALITTGSGDMSIISGERIFQTVRAHLSGRVWAARLHDGRIATVGADGFLRDWSVPSADTFGVPTSIGFIDESARMASILGVHAAPRESARNQIRIPAVGHLAVTAVPGYAHVVTTESLETTNRRFFSGLVTDISLSQDGSHIASVGPERSRSFRFDESEEFWIASSTPELPGTTVPTAIGDGGKAVSAVSNDGSTILIADEYQVSRRRDGDNSDERFDIARHPVSLSPDPTGAGSVLTADGYLRHSDGSEERLDLPWSDPPLTVAAAQPDGEGGFTLVTEDGQLFTSSADGLASVGSIGAGNGAFALRTAPDGRRIAVIGEQGIVVFDTGSRRVVFWEAASGASTVTDVVFADDDARLYAVTEIGAVRSIEITGDGNALQPEAPRTLTPQESTLFNLGGD
ncbi:WD40 repeat domain-containing protein [Mycobacterium sp. NPDC051198]